MLFFNKSYFLRKLCVSFIIFFTIILSFPQNSIAKKLTPEEVIEKLKLDNQVFGVRSAKGTQNFVSTQFFDVPKAGLSDIENTK